MKTLWSLSDYLYIPLPVETEISDMPLQSDSCLDVTFLPKFVIKYLLISVENYFMLSCKFQSF